MDKEKIDELYVLCRETGCIQSFYMYREMDAASTKGYDLIIILISWSFYEGDKKLKMIFHNVKELNVGNPCGIYLEDLKITDVSDKGLEGMKYYVTDFEMRIFSFICQDIEYEIL